MKRIRCGTCKKRFPLGGAHNSRTCDKPKHTPQQGSPRKRENKTVKTPPLGLTASHNLSTEKGELQDVYTRVKFAQPVSDANLIARQLEDCVKLIGIDINVERGKPDGVEILLVNRVVHSTKVDVGRGKFVEACYDKDGELVEGWKMRNGKPVVLVKISPTTAVPELQQTISSEVVFVNEEGYLESQNGNPAHVVDGKVYEWCDSKGNLHNLSGPAYINPTYHLWFADGERTNTPEMCEKAIRADLTDEEFYELCSHEDYVVRQLAAHNPQCPVEWRTLVEIMDG